MSSEREAINVIPSDIDINGIADTFNNPAQIFGMLDKNNDGKITNVDLETLLSQFGIHGMAATILSRYLFNQLDANDNGTIDISDLTNAGQILWSLLGEETE